MKTKVPLTREDKKAIALLIVLCAFSLPCPITPPSSPDLFR
jgi:hypothetical protein